MICTVTAILGTARVCQLAHRTVYILPVKYRCATDTGRTRLLFYSLEEAAQVQVGWEFKS